MTKVCKRCNKEHPIERFSFHGRSPDGLAYECQSCRSDYYQANKGRFYARLLEYRTKKKQEREEEKLRNPKPDNSALISEETRQRRAKNKEYADKHRLEHPNYQKEYQAKYRKTHMAKRAEERRIRKENKMILRRERRLIEMEEYKKEKLIEKEFKAKIKYGMSEEELRNRAIEEDSKQLERLLKARIARARRKALYVADSERRLKMNRERQAENRKINGDFIREKERTYQKNRRISHPAYKLRHSVSAAIGSSLKHRGSSKRGKKTFDYIGYTLIELKTHLESQFEPWMNWSNHGGRTDDPRQTWHIDHIIPQSSFNFDSLESDEFKKCWALSNLRPLEKIANIKKGNKLCVLESSVSESLGKPVSSDSNLSVIPLESMILPLAPA